jgi:hypothetical protein
MKTLTKISNKNYLNVRQAVTEGIISKRTARSLLGAGRNETISVAGLEMMNFDSLSTKIKNRVLKFVKKSEPVKEDLKYEDKLAEIEFILTFAYTSDSIWRKNLTHFTQMYLKDGEQIILAKTYSFVHTMLGLKDEGYLLKQIYNAYKNLSTKFTLSNFNCNNYDYFTSKLKDISVHGIEVGIINTKRSTIRLAKKVTPVHEKLLKKYYAAPARFGYKKIKELVNHEVIKLGLHPISLSSVKMFLVQPEIQNTYKPFRYGKKWAEDILYPYLIRAKPKKTNYQWQSDCTCLNFYVANSEGGNPSRRWLCIVIDTKSRKYLAHKIGRYETAALVEATFLQAVLNTNILPFEIVHDNSSAYCSKRIVEIENRMAELGTCVRKSRPENPQDKGLAESRFGFMQNYLRNQRGYLGDSVRSFNEEGRVDPAERSAYFAGKNDGIWTEEDLNEMINNVIAKMNNNDL